MLDILATVLLATPSSRSLLRSLCLYKPKGNDVSDSIKTYRIRRFSFSNESLQFIFVFMKNYFLIYVMLSVVDVLLIDKMKVGEAVDCVSQSNLLLGWVTG